MRAVSNTSPISNLAFIGRLSLLRSQFSEIWIPPAVLHELSIHPDKNALAAIQSAINDKWINSMMPLRSHLLNVLSLHLHRGEAEALALAADLKVDIVVIDEQEGRQFATQAGLSVIGVLGVLLHAKKSGQVSDIKPEIQPLRSKARFFIAASLEAKVLADAGE